ncbi:hypothetical protein D3C84_861620 [compost metagenome]
MHFAGARTGDDDRRVARHGAGAAADFQAIDAGQHQVENQGIPVALLQQAHAFGAVGAVHDLELLITQMQADQVGDMQVILDHEDAFGLFHPAHPLARCVRNAANENLVGAGLPAKTAARPQLM